MAVIVYQSFLLERRNVRDKCFLYAFDMNRQTVQNDCLCIYVILPGEGSLTSEALKKHNAFLGVGKSGSEESQDDDGDATFGGTFKTFQTFASDWSECSNVSFNK
jgi:hypothetical protein